LADALIAAGSPQEYISCGTTIAKLERRPMGIRQTLRRLEQKADVVTVELRCPECGAEFKAIGDPIRDPISEYLVYEWGKGFDGKSYRQTPADVLAIAEHEHDPSCLINKATGEPWLGELLAGTVRIPDDVPDLSEQAKAERGEVLE
jgi:hypothetical protein